MLRLQQSGGSGGIKKKIMINNNNNANAQKPDTVCYTPLWPVEGTATSLPRIGGANHSGFQGKSEGELEAFRHCEGLWIVFCFFGVGGWVGSM